MNPLEETGTRPPETRSILVECTEIVFRTRPAAMLSHIPVAILALWIGWESKVGLSNYIAVALLVTYAVLGMISAHSFNAKRPTEAAAKRARIELYVVLPILGLIYNFLFLNLELHGVPHALDYQLLVLSLFCAGAAATYQHLRGLAIAFIVPAILPLALYYLMRGSREGNFMALLLFVFIVFMSSVSLNLYDDTIERLTLTRELTQAKDEAERQARIDSLTGLLNRRAFFETGHGLLAWARRHDRPLSLLMIDLDHFKSINDRFGHSAGDAVLAAFAQTVRKTERKSDVSGRLGGEEFAILLPETGAAAAAQFALRLRETIRAVTVDAENPAVKLTASIGITERTPADLTLDALIDRADRALYRAKAEGRDRVLIEPPSA